MGKLNILVKNRVIDQYYHDGKTFVEGRKGSDYTIQYYNNSPNRVKVVLSVDGLNVISGDTDWKRGYVVEPWGTLNVPGWRKDNNNVAKFVFSSIHGSYNQHNDSGDVNNVGVIGAMVFNEQPQVIWNSFTLMPEPYYDHKPWPKTVYRSYGMSPKTYNATFGGGEREVKTSGTIGGSLGQATFTATCAAGAMPQNSVDCAYLAGGLDLEPQSADVGHVGTGYGANQHFATHEVSYNFYDTASETLSIYYDDIRGLRNRGINVYTKAKPEPNPFPTYRDGCPPPKYQYRR